MTDAERFAEHLEEARRIVASWPEWKRNVLGKPMFEHEENADRIERELDDAAALLTRSLAIGRVKAIGMMEVHEAIRKLVNERDDLRSALCIARVNARQQHGMTLRKFAALCGHSPSWVSRWTDSDSDPQTPPDFVD